MQFLLRLAAYLHKSLTEVVSLSTLEVRLWRAWYELEPWGEERDDLRAAQIVQAVATGPLKDPGTTADYAWFSVWKKAREDTRTVDDKIDSVFGRLAAQAQQKKQG